MAVEKLTPGLYRLLLVTDEGAYRVEPLPRPEGVARRFSIALPMETPIVVEDGPEGPSCSCQAFRSRRSCPHVVAARETGLI